jgi:hypothetical protein
MRSRTSPTPPSGPRPRLGRRPPAAWQGPTLGEFLARAESEFGAAARHAAAADVAALSTRARSAGSLTGLASGERLSPGSLRELCRSWGLPAEDFGVEPD